MTRLSATPRRSACCPPAVLGRLRSELAYGTPEDIQQEGVHQFLDRFQTALNDLGGDLSKAYFNPGASDDEDDEPADDPDAEAEPEARATLRQRQG